jgi:hypothetical protein
MILDVAELEDLTDEELERRFTEAERNALTWMGATGRHVEHQSARWMSIAERCRAEIHRRAGAPPKLRVEPALAASPFVLEGASVTHDRPLPQLFDGDALRLLVASAKTETASIDLALAARAGDDVVGFGLRIHGIGVGFNCTAELRSLGAPSDAFARAATRSRSSRTMAACTECALMVSHTYEPRDLTWKDAEVRMQVGTAPTWFDVRFAGDAGHVVIPVPGASRRRFFDQITVSDGAGPTPRRRRRS